ncbi:ATP-binding protein [Funiculus sociatus GB2-A5]|uniref:ATP-binding protein n=1 Tax=Funiculus sociatus GB2-A5 TaxID=2933946 RepID=A0ABV0JK44_9CYAN|nr:MULTISPECIES: ATP-binding protein [unclassified Trichocoleus]MBD1904699.1 ATP-binding protein [Trichocoleus sp. FACHB-832]MBD2062497.1 ATP-binding protein [Trichocoleus sp. FACHB-6]
MAISFKASKKGLEIVDRARRKKGWAATALAWCAAANTSGATLKRFRTGRPIQQDVFIAICKAVGIENWEAIVDNSPSPQTDSRPEFFAYDYAWVGREQLVAELSQKVRGSCRLLILVGITGIGKTALAEKLAVDLQDWFQGDWKQKFWRANFDYEDKATDFASVAVKWLEEWGESVLPEDKEPERLLHRSVKYLRENQVLLLIDSLEGLLKGNEEYGWGNFADKWWVRFFQNLLAAESCQSRLILTSEDLPAQVLAIGTRYPNFWYCQPLSGLAELESLDLFEKTGIEVGKESPNRPYLDRIRAVYEGHPLALRAIAGEIGNKPFNGNVVAYWNKHSHEIEEVEKAIEEAKTKGLMASADDRWQLDRYTRGLRRQVRVRLEKTFNRLNKDVHYAYVLLCEASVYRCPVPEEFWLSHLEDWDLPEDWNDQKSQQMLDALRERYLVEEVIDNNQCLLRQHNLIRSVAIEHLKQLGEDDE